MHRSGRGGAQKVLAFYPKPQTSNHRPDTLRIWELLNPKPQTLWVVRIGGDDGELRQWHYIYIYSILSRLIMRVRHDSHFLMEPPPPPKVSSAPSKHGCHPANFRGRFLPSAPHLKSQTRHPPDLFCFNPQPPPKGIKRAVKVWLPPGDFPGGLSTLSPTPQIPDPTPSGSGCF